MKYTYSKETIESIKKFIRAKEADYLKSKRLVPLTQTECAAHVGISASSVSRIIASGTKIKLGNSEYPLSFFFSQRKIHPRVFNEWVNKVIEEEDPANPISDRELLKEFKKEFPEDKLKPRTIRKYREKAGIDSSSGRRRTKLINWILKTIESEDPRRPMSDKMLVELFKKDHPQSKINKGEMTKLRQRAGIKGLYLRRKKIGTAV